MSCKTTPSSPNSFTGATPTKPRAEEVLLIVGLTEFHVIATMRILIQSIMFFPVSSPRFLVRTAKTKSDTNPVYFILEAQNLDSLLRVNSENKRYSVIERVLPSAEHETEPFTAERLSRKEVLIAIIPNKSTDVISSVILNSELD